MLIDMSINQFLAALSADSPAPGGGSVAALAGALSAGLVAMVGRLSTKDEANHKQITKIISLADNYGLQLRHLVDRDTEAFMAVMDAFKMPKGTPDEKQARRQMVQTATKQAANTPLEVMETVLRVLELALEIAQLGNPNAISDAGVAGLMGQAALKAACYNVEINLLGIKDQQFVSEKKEKLDKLKAKASKLSTEIGRIVQAKLV